MRSKPARLAAALVLAVLLAAACGHRPVAHVVPAGASSPAPATATSTGAGPSGGSPSGGPNLTAVDTDLSRIDSALGSVNGDVNAARSSQDTPDSP